MSHDMRTSTTYLEVPRSAAQGAYLRAQSKLGSKSKQCKDIEGATAKVHTLN